MINVNINKINPRTAGFVTVNLKVGRTVNATFSENRSQGTRGVPLNAVIKWFIIPIIPVTTEVIIKLIFTFPIND